MTERELRYPNKEPQFEQSIMPCLDQGDPTLKRQQLQHYFQQSYAIEDALFDTLRYTDSFYQRADPLRHPLIFYYGHTAVFYINKLIAGRVINERINPHFESMFAIGVDEMSWDDLNEENYDWPSVADVEHYRQQVYTKVENLILSLELQLPINWQSLWWPVVMGIEHQRIHLETSSVLIRQLPLQLLRQHPLWQPCPLSGEPESNQLLEVNGGKVELGKPYDHPLYGWDCEYGQRHEQVAAFKCAQFLVSNREFLPFIEAGGYTERRWWSDEGWQWCRYEKAQQPRFWRARNGNYRLRTLLAEQPMPWNWPVETNFHEAKAFCHWKSHQLQHRLRLPTEAEWLLWRDQQLGAQSPAEHTHPANINLNHFASSCPVDHFMTPRFGDVVGNVWQWTETIIDSLPGFKVHPCYDDFSTPTFDGQHNLFKGGSWISTGNEASREARYAFRRHFYQHAGFRYVQSPQNVDQHTTSSETDSQIARLCEDHYAVDSKQQNFMQTLAILAIQSCARHQHKQALQIGCEVGRGCFELARHFDGVTGIDLSANMIRRAIEMAENGCLSYELIEEGELTSHHQCRLTDSHLEGFANKVAFFQADPCNLKRYYQGYDLILISQVLERLYAPQQLLNTLANRLTDDGILVISTSFDWQETTTTKQHWIGGQRIDGEPLLGQQHLASLLQQQFIQQSSSQQLSRQLHEHRHRSTVEQAEISIWKKRPQ